MTDDELELLDAFPGAELADELADDLERMAAKARAAELLDELDVGSTVVRAQMLSDPERAVLVLESALKATGVRNPAAFAVKRWRAGYDPRRARSAPTREPEPEREQPPELDAIEHAWSLEGESAVAGYVLQMMRASIERTGGVRPILERAFGR